MIITIYIEKRSSFFRFSPFERNKREIFLREQKQKKREKPKKNHHHFYGRKLLATNSIESALAFVIIYLWKWTIFTENVSLNFSFVLVKN